MRNISKVIFVIIGTVIGAGFASGKEIYVFFNEYQGKGLYGLIISAIITGTIIYKILISQDKENIKNYEQYLDSLKINLRVKNILNNIMNIFLLISFYIMIAGFCTYFKQEFNISHYISSIIVAVMCFFTFKSNIEGIMKINTILIPLLIFIILIISIKSNFFNNINTLEENMSLKRK